MCVCVCVCVCVNSEGSREPAREWTLCIIPRTKNDWIKGLWMEIPTQYWHFCFNRFIAYAYSHCAEVDSEGGRFPPVFKYPIKWNQTKIFYFHWIFKKKEIKSAHPPLYIWTPLSRNPGSVTVVLTACSHVYLLACMQQCACLSVGARSIFCLGFRLPLFFVCARTMGPRCVQRMPWLLCICTCSSELSMFAY